MKQEEHAKQHERESDESSISSGFGNMEQQESRTDKDHGISEKATKTVWSIRAMFLTILVFSTLGVALAVYFYITTSEEKEFEDQFYEDSSKVLQALGTSLDLTLGVTDSLSVALVSYATYSNSAWPFVTLPDFGVRAAKIRNVAKAMVLGVYPIVQTNEREEWENYTDFNTAWVDDAIALQTEDKTFQGLLTPEWQGWNKIHNNDGMVETPGPYMPTWTTSPVVAVYSPYNWDLYSPPETRIIRQALKQLMRNNHVVLGLTNNLPDPNDPNDVEAESYTIEWVRGYIGDSDDPSEPLITIYYPILDQATRSVQINPSESKLVGVIAVSIFWRDLMRDILPTGSNGMLVVISNPCNQTFTYQINGPDTQFLGRGDHHENKYDGLRRQSVLAELESFASGQSSYTGSPLSMDYCPYQVEIYPSHNMEDRFTSNNAVIFTLVAVSIFLFTSLFFLIYDFFVQRRQREVLKTAVQSTAIVSSLFPENVRDRLVSEQNHLYESQKARFLSVVDGGNGKDSSSPIAELFPDCTVMFADIAGFTAWCSVREAGQVFHLLEAVYGAFDEIAMHRGVFKVETIGDSYLAVCGLPNPRKDHAVVMVRFACACREKMNELTHDLESILGPDTGDLQMRFGLNSGPVTAGVIRGERCRFQLFGDTVNTAARMESTGVTNLIHVTEATADQLRRAGKGHWVTTREGMVEAKGKGKMQTYWCDPKSTSSSQSVAASNSSIPLPSTELETKTLRLIEWNKQLFSRLLQQVVAHRQRYPSLKKMQQVDPPRPMLPPDSTVVDEVVDAVQIPTALTRNPSHTVVHQSDSSTQVSARVMDQLGELIAGIARMYQDLPFHSFDHASHVTMSVSKLISRIASIPDPDTGTSQIEGNDSIRSLHDPSYGISSDPLAQFAVVFAALIHDVDHPGVTNAQLVRENANLAAFYKNKSVTEQNSMDLSWTLLQDERFQALRETLLSTEVERTRFRQIVVNGVMATDIVDPELMAWRGKRWENAFAPSSESAQSQDLVQSRKATLVMELMLQASDVAHTMQHWHIYCKWSKRLFREMQFAYQKGRAERDPSKFWYEEQMQMFDNFVIPLCHRLVDCGAFGASSEEYLNYACKNRQEWKENGQQIVSEMVERGF